jgi:glycerophosphoryl diester phosphodiesterase
MLESYRGLVLSLALVAASLTAHADLSAHRGDVTVAPENTIPAFKAAVAKGVPQIEFDVNLSKDGKLVVIHDATVDRTTNGKGKVTDLTFEELRALDAGSWFGEAFKGVQIPTLRETLEAIPENILCNVHLKNDEEVAVKSAQLIQEMGRLEQCFLATSLENIAAARAVVPEIKVCNMTRQAGDRPRYIRETIENKCDFIQLHQRDGHENLAAEVQQLKSNGVTVNWFGANDAPLIQLLHDAGVDYILTDRLDLALETLGTGDE